MSFVSSTTPLSLTRIGMARVAAVLSMAWLAACGPMGVGGTGPSIKTGAAVPVALLVPGSMDSGDAILAQSLENAARLAISDLGGVQIDLRVYSTGSSAAQAAQVATIAVDDGAKILLGPVFAESSNAAGLAVASRGVNVLSFSNNTDIAGGNVFVLGNTFANTANRLVDFSARQGLNNILVVQGNNTAEQIGGRAIQRAIAGSGATLAGVETYDFSQDGVIEAIPRIAARVRTTGANAMFFTSDSAGALPLFAQLLPENKVDPSLVKYIGLTRWDIPAATLSLPGVQGGWFALPDQNMATQFSARYSAAFGSLPHPIAGLAYDGIAAIGALVQAGASDALTTAALTQGSGFVGVNGIFRLRPDGSNERGMAIAEIRNNQVVIIDPAPKSFGRAGF